MVGITEGGKNGGSGFPVFPVLSGTCCGFCQCWHTLYVLQALRVAPAQFETLLSEVALLHLVEIAQREDTPPAVAGRRNSRGGYDRLDSLSTAELRSTVGSVV